MSKKDISGEQVVAQEKESLSQGYFAQVDLSDVGLTLEGLFKSGVHFGHKRERRHPHMDEFVYTYRDGVAIIDLKKTLALLEESLAFIKKLSQENKKIVFVGTKKHIQKLIESLAIRCEQPYVSGRWIGGTFTNFPVIRKRITYLIDQEAKFESGEFDKYTKFEQSRKKEEFDRLEKKMGGLRLMSEMPGALFVADVKQDRIAIEEASRTGVPVIAFVDTNDNPKGVDYPIPANNDALSSLKLLLGLICKTIEEGKSK